MTEPNAVTVNIFRSSKRSETYLFLPENAEFSDLPEALRKTFGRPIAAMSLALTPNRKLARAEAPKVLAALAAQGFYLQVPPPTEHSDIPKLPEELLQ